MKDDVILMACKINATGKVLFWKIEKEQVAEIGDYAIVENIEGYDLVQIMGYVLTKRELTRYISNTKYENMKEVKMTIKKEKLKKEKINE